LTGFVTLLSFLYIGAEIRSYTAALQHPARTPLFLQANGSPPFAPKDIHRGLSMTHKSLFKEAARHYVQRGQMSDGPPQPVRQPVASAPASYGDTDLQMSAMAFGSSTQPPRPPAGSHRDP
jgi:hypothetical protein